MEGNWPNLVVVPQLHLIHANCNFVLFFANFWIMQSSDTQSNQMKCFLVE